MERELIQELKAQLEDHDELVVTDTDGRILDVEDVSFDSRNGRIQIKLAEFENG